MLKEEFFVFDFGENWKNFSSRALTPERVDLARNDFIQLTKGISLKGKSFLDIGFGQGLSLLNAHTLGAICTGCDINPKCEEALNANLKFYPGVKKTDITVFTGSILNMEILQELISNCPDQNSKKFDIVHSWGVLHHTGKLWDAITNAASLVKYNGHLVIAIYNRHWSSPFWLYIKWMYNISPGFIKWLMIKKFYLIIALAKFMVTGKNPFAQKRGMDFYYDVIDWLGGYPYQYAKAKTIIDFVSAKGFKLLKFIPAEVPTGCNEFIFLKLDKSREKANPKTNTPL